MTINSDYGMKITHANAILNIITKKSSTYFLTKDNTPFYPFDGFVDADDEWYIGLSTTQPQINESTDAIENFTEPSSGGYARVAVVQNATYWSTAANGRVHNLLYVDFPRTTATWGTLTHFGIFLSASGSTPVLWGKLSSSISPSLNSIPSFSPGSLVISLIGA